MTNDIIQLLRANAAGITSFLRSICAMQAYISVPEIYVLCIVFESPAKREFICSRLPRDHSTVYHVIANLKKRGLVVEKDATIFISEKGTEYYRLFLNLLVKSAEIACLQKSGRVLP